ncbi:glycosyltransferase [Flavobacteriaceae bacterium]|nr:glycosyltransferase [Flavobacteriaceae bacterium]
MNKLNILIITYYWPPSGGSGVQRWMFFAKYLKQFGHNPIILTVDPKYASYNLTDNSLIDQVKDIEVHKTASFEILKLYSIFKSGNKTRAIPQSYIPTQSIFDKIALFIRLNFFIPDSRIGWNYFAFKKAKKLIEDNNINCIITSGPPHSSHLIGKKIYNKFKLKWIVDLRDPWAELFYLKNKFQFNYVKKLNLKFEVDVLNSADAILTTVGKRYKSILKDKLSNTKKIYKIYNGYDKIAYDKIEEIKPDSYNIVFTGILSKNHNYQLFLEVLSLLKEKYKDLNMIFTFAGKIDEKIKNLFSEKIRLIDNGYVTHDKAIKIIKSSHLLINFTYLNTEDTDMVSGKLIEYLASGSPIINFSNSAKESNIIMQNSRKSFNADSNDLMKVMGFIKKEYDDWLDGNYKKEIPKNIESLSREKLTNNLIDLIKNLVV